jgi:ketosteroid isomerase-like protein
LDWIRIRYFIGLSFAHQDVETGGVASTSRWKFLLEEVNMQEIKDLILARAERLTSGDAAAVQAFNAPSVVEYSLAPPLGGPADGRDPKPLQAWFETFEAPPRREVTRLEITADGDVAFATSLDSMTATPKGSTESFTLWYRVTLGLRRIGGQWLITHEHESVPFLMDGSLRAAVHLEP